MLMFCCGMLRAGSTLQYNIARLALETAAKGVGRGYREPKDIDLDSAALQDWIQSDRINVVKVHSLPSMDALSRYRKGIRLAYIYRDIRDVAVSVRKKFKRSGADLHDAIDRALQLDARVFELRSMLGESAVMVQQYERVISDLPTAIREMAAFLDVSLTVPAAQAIERSCSLEGAKAVASAAEHNKGSSALMRLLQRIGIRRASYDAQTLLHPDHISDSAGAVGIWRLQLAAEDRSFLENRYSQWLNERGYR
jgi:hypothetical protein